MFVAQHRSLKRHTLGDRNRIGGAFNGPDRRSGRRLRPRAWFGAQSRNESFRLKIQKYLEFLQSSSSWPSAGWLTSLGADHVGAADTGSGSEDPMTGTPSIVGTPPILETGMVFMAGSVRLFWN
jgi:hypothetical protein